jgi:hypothetical protein
MLGDIKIQDLTTGQIRTWHKTVSSEASAYSANRAKMYLAAAPLRIMDSPEAPSADHWRREFKNQPRQKSGRACNHEVTAASAFSATTLKMAVAASPDCTGVRFDTI